MLATKRRRLESQADRMPPEAPAEGLNTKEEEKPGGRKEEALGGDVLELRLLEADNMESPSDEVGLDVAAFGVVAKIADVPGREEEATG